MVKIHSLTEALMHSGNARTYAEGEVIFNEGRPATEMYIVREGTIELRKGGAVLERLVAGDVLGEMALIDPAPRSATAVAGPGCRLVVLDEETFNQLVRTVPGFALELLRVVVRRLRKELTRG